MTNVQYLSNLVFFGSHIGNIKKGGEMVRFYTETKTIDGETSVTHSKNSPARFVSFLDENGLNIEIPWQRDPADENNKIIAYSGEELLNIEVNIICKS